VAIALVLLHGPADADRPTVFVQVADLCRLKLAHSRSALVDDEERDDVMAREDLGDTLDVFGQRRRDVRLPLAGELGALVPRLGPTPREVPNRERNRNEACSWLASGLGRGRQKTAAGATEWSTGWAGAERASATAAHAAAVVAVPHRPGRPDVVPRAGGDQLVTDEVAGPGDRDDLGHLSVATVARDRVRPACTFPLTTERLLSMLSRRALTRSAVV
jgi:hypothetical protein